MAQAVSAAAHRRAVLPPPKPVEKLQGRIVNHLPSQAAKEALEVTVHVAEILSFLDPSEMEAAALVIAPRFIGHAKMGKQAIKSHCREKTRMSTAELVNLQLRFSERLICIVGYMPAFFLKYFPQLREIELQEESQYGDFDFIPSNIRKLCPDFQGLRIPHFSMIHSPQVLIKFNERVPLHSLAYKLPMQFPDAAIDSFTQLRVVNLMGAQPRQVQMDAIGRLPRLCKLIMDINSVDFNGFEELQSLVLGMVYERDFQDEDFISNLAALPKLKALHLYLMGECSISQLAQLPHLETLALANYVCLEGLQKLMQTSPKLSAVILDSTPQNIHIVDSLEDALLSQQLKKLQEQFPHIALLGSRNIKDRDTLETQLQPFFPDLLKPKHQELPKGPAIAAAPLEEDVGLLEEDEEWWV